MRCLSDIGQGGQGDRDPSDGDGSGEAAFPGPRDGRLGEDAVQPSIFPPEAAGVPGQADGVHRCDGSLCDRAFLGACCPCGWP